jgi:hypothetical protein
VIVVAALEAPAVIADSGSVLTPMLTHLPPPVINGGTGVRDPHVVLQLGHMFLCGSFLRKRPGQHEFGLEHGPPELTRPSSVAAIHL